MTRPLSVTPLLLALTMAACDSTPSVVADGAADRSDAGALDAARPADAAPDSSGDARGPDADTEPADAEPVGPSPLDYADPANWAAHPDRADDETDRVGAQLEPGPNVAVFFLHPTTVGEDDLSWVGNADVADPAQRAELDGTVAGQSLAFGGAAQIYGPRYRDISLGAQVQPAITAEVEAARAIAYADVRAAFEAFVADLDPAAPFVLAGHSQGASWLVWLLRDAVEGTALAERMVAAYVVGEFAGPDTFRVLPACETPDAVGCVVTYVTLAEGADPLFTCGSTRFPACGSSPPNTREEPWCFNPLTGAASPTSAADAMPTVTEVGPLDGEIHPFDIRAWCTGGALRIDPMVDRRGTGSLQDWLGEYAYEGDWHIFDVTLFFGALRADVDRRLEQWSDR